jgi:hypothetical protein
VPRRGSGVEWMVKLQLVPKSRVSNDINKNISKSLCQWSSIIMAQFSFEEFLNACGSK